MPRKRYELTNKQRTEELLKELDKTPRPSIDELLREHNIDPGEFGFDMPEENKTQ